MNKKLLLILLLSFIKPTHSLGQNTVDSITYALKTSDYFKADNWVDRIQNNKLKELFSFQIDYYKNGVKNKLPDDDLSQIKNDKDSILYHYLLADAYTIYKIPQQDSLIFKNYLNSYKKALKLKDSSLVSDVLRKLNFHLMYKTRDSIVSKKYINIYKNYLLDNSDHFWYFYLQIGYNFMLTENRIESVNKEKMQYLYKNLLLRSENNYFHKGLYYQILGIYQAHWLKEYKSANNSNLKAKSFYKKIPFWYTQFKIKGLEYNMAVNNFKDNEFRKAIPYFKKDLKRDKEKVFTMYTYEWLFKSYEGLKQYDSAHYYFKQMINIRDQIDQQKHSRAIRKIEGQYNLNEKEIQLKTLAKKNKALQNQFLTILPILGITILILVFIFYLYKRFKKKNIVLEEEKSKTLQKLDELKSIVIKNHIVLKDKTKVYISNLLYIKSEDHYLRVYTTEDKNDKGHLVRGKLGQIKQELPPNFIQCHRSYIVNTNFIKQRNNNSLTLMHRNENGKHIVIPVSRSFKDKLR